MTNLQIQYTLEEMREKGIPIRPYAEFLNPVVKAYDLVYLRFQRSDLERTRKELSDFGMLVVQHDDDTLYLRAANDSPFCYINQKGSTEKFLGFGLSVTSRNDLVKLSKLEGASEIHHLSSPGGGECVTLTDPGGFQIDVVFGIEKVELLPERETSKLNFPIEKQRVNEYIRWDGTPPLISRLGHVVLKTIDHCKTVEWYRKTFGLLISDIHHLDDGTPYIAFMRCDRGKEACHMHQVALAQYVDNEFDHAGFEVVDMDAVAFGNRFLKEQSNWKSIWGIGRHWLASAVFDYWADSDSFMHEHFADEDVYDDEHPTHYSLMAASNLYQWGPSAPNFFKLTFRNIYRVIKAVLGNNDITLRQLKMAKKAMSR